MNVAIYICLGAMLVFAFFSVLSRHLINAAISLAAVSAACGVLMYLVQREQRDAARLRESFDDQHTGHDFLLVEMSLKVPLIAGDRFHALGGNAVDQLIYAIHHQKRLAMRQNLLDLFYS